MGAAGPELGLQVPPSPQQEKGLRPALHREGHAQQLWEAVRMSPGALGQLRKQPHLRTTVPQLPLLG